MLPTDSDTKMSRPYYSKADADLADCADPGPWQATRKVLEYFPNADSMEVTLIDDQTDLNKVNQQLLQQKRIGLIVMGTKIDRSCKPALIVLSTAATFYAIDPEDELRGMRFLKMKLNDSKLEFWTSNCYAESDCLYHNYGIELAKVNAKSCVGVNLTMMKKLAVITQCARNAYPPGAANNWRRPLKLEHFDDLISMYSNVDPDDLKFDPKQLAHLSKRPLSQTAVNVIKKRCIMVLVVARSLVIGSEAGVRGLSSTMFRRLKDAGNNPQLRSVAVSLYKQALAEGKADHSSLGHFVEAPSRP